MPLQDVLSPIERRSSIEDSQSKGLPKGPFKSWRKKYRKMHAVFEEKMRENGKLARDADLLMAKARRLQERNDQLLEILIDVNESTSLTSHLHLNSDIPHLSQVPALEADNDPHYHSKPSHDDTTKDAITTDPSHSLPLSSLLRDTLHTDNCPDSLLPPDLTGDIPGYFSPTHEEEYLDNVDTAVASNSHRWTARLMRAAAEKVLPSEKDVILRNPVSVYNWLRRNQPNVFLQDKEAVLENGGGGSEKSSAPRAAAGASTGAAATPGGSSQRGKRGSLAAGTGNNAAAKAEQEMWDEEIGFVAETGIVGGGGSAAKGRRGKGDDEAYRPPRSGGKGGKRKRPASGEENGAVTGEKPAKRKYVRQSLPSS